MGACIVIKTIYNYVFWHFSNYSCNIEVPRRELNTKNLPVEWEIPCISRQVSVGVTTVPVWIHSDGRRLQSRNQNKHKLSLVTKIEISLEHLRLKYRYLEVELHLKSRAAVRSTLTPVESKAADSGSLADDEWQRHAGSVLK